MVEGVPVELPKHTGLVGGDGGCSWSVVEKCKFSEGFSWLVCLEEGWVSVARENFGAEQCSRADHVQAVALFALGDDDVVDFDADFFHSIDDDFLVLLFESREHESHVELFGDLFLGCFVLGDNLWYEGGLFIVNSECLG